MFKLSLFGASATQLSIFLISKFFKDDSSILKSSNKYAVTRKVLLSKIPGVLTILSHNAFSGDANMVLLILCQPNHT